MKLVNLTPHIINICDKNGKIILSIPSSGNARVTVKQNVVDEINDIPVVKTEYGQVIDLPEPREGTVYIVSNVVRGVVQGRRNDVVSPDTGPSAIRNKDGQIIGVTRLTR